MAIYIIIDINMSVKIETPYYIPRNQTPCLKQKPDPVSTLIQVACCQSRQCNLHYHFVLNSISMPLWDLYAPLFQFLE